MSQAARGRPPRSRPPLSIAAIMFLVAFYALLIASFRWFNPLGFYLQKTFAVLIEADRLGVLPSDLVGWGMRYSRTIAAVLTIATYAVVSGALFFLLIPVLVFFSRTFPQVVGFKEVDPAWAEIGPGSQKALQAGSGELAALGFVPRGCYRAVRGAPWIDTLIAAYEKADTGDLAKHMVVQARGKVFQSVWFRREWPGGDNLWTSNSRHPQVTPQLPTRRQSMTFPDVTDLALLYRLHLGRLTGEPPGELFGPDVPAALLATERKAADLWVARGIMTSDPARVILRPTLKGACVLGWLSLPPVPWVRRMIMRRKAANLMATLK